MPPARYVASDSHSDKFLGYVRFSDERWTLWQIPGEAERPLPGFELKRSSVPALLERLTSDGRGGAYGLWGGGLYGIDPNGAIEFLGSTSSGVAGGEFDEALALEAGSGAITVVASTIGDGGRALRLKRVDPARGVVTAQNVSPPDWFLDARFAPSLIDPSLSVAGKRTWISAGPLLFALKPGPETVVYYSPEIPNQLEKRERARLLDDIQRLGASILGAVVPLAGGALAASRIHRERFLVTIVQAAAAAALSLVPAWALDASLCGGWSLGLGTAVAILFFYGGISGAPLLAAFGAWQAGRHCGLRAPARAFAGALLGASAATALSVYLTAHIVERHRDFKFVTLALTLGLIGGAATIGYHALCGKGRLR